MTIEILRELIEPARIPVFDCPDKKSYWLIFRPSVTSRRVKDRSPGGILEGVGDSCGADMAPPANYPFEADVIRDLLHRAQQVFDGKRDVVIRIIERGYRTSEGQFGPGFKVGYVAHEVSTSCAFCRSSQRKRS